MKTIFFVSIDTNVASLQRVKEMLRRLRWQQERSTVPQCHHKSHSIKTFVQQIASDLCKFVCGEKAGNQSHSQESSFSWEVEPREMALALDDQQKKAEVHVMCHFVLAGSCESLMKKEIFLHAHLHVYVIHQIVNVKVVR